jgi:nicotinamidase-related amidase
MSKVIKTMIDPNDAVMLLIDHQSGLFQLVKDIDVPSLRNNVIALAKAAKLAKVPTFTTASVPDGPNGPLIPEIHKYNPEAVYIPRTGQIKTPPATGRRWRPTSRWRASCRRARCRSTLLPFWPS